MFVELAPAAVFFAALQPMEPLSKKDPFDSPAFFYQIKWDGVRIMALVEQHRVILKNRKGRLRTGQYPELQKLAELLDVKSAVLDGEMVALNGGKPSFARVLRRDLCRRELPVRALQRQIPCTYCLFDLLYLDGIDLTGSPLAERHRLLEKTVRAVPPLYLNENYQEGTALYRKVEQAGLEGVVAKKKMSSYRGGKKSGDWLKIKPRRRQLCVIGGLNMPGGSVSSLLLGAYCERELLFIGKAGSGLKRTDLLLLRDYVLQGAAAKPCFSNPPRGRDLFWLAPRLTVQVEFAEWTGGLKMRAPVVIGFSNRSPEEAII